MLRTEWMCLALLCVCGCGSGWEHSLASLDANETWRVYLTAVRSKDLTLCRRLMTDRAKSIALLDSRIELEERVDLLRAMVAGRYGGKAADWIPKAWDLVRYPELPETPMPPLERRSPSLYVAAGTNTAIRRIGGRWRVGLHATPTAHRLGLAAAASSERLEEKLADIDGMISLVRANEAGDRHDLKKRMFSLSQGLDPSRLLTDEEYKYQLRYLRQEKWRREQPWTEFTRNLRARLLPYNEAARECPTEMVRGGDNAIVLELVDDRSDARKKAFIEGHTIDECFVVNGDDIPVASDLWHWGPDRPGFFETLPITDGITAGHESLVVRYQITMISREGEGRTILWVTDPISVDIVDGNGPSRK